MDDDDRQSIEFRPLEVAEYTSNESNYTIRTFHYSAFTILISKLEVKATHLTLYQPQEDFTAQTQETLFNF